MYAKHSSSLVISSHESWVRGDAGQVESQCSSTRPLREEMINLRVVSCEYQYISLSIGSTQGDCTTDASLDLRHSPSSSTPWAHWTLAKPYAPPFYPFGPSFWSRNWNHVLQSLLAGRESNTRRRGTLRDIRTPQKAVPSSRGRSRSLAGLAVSSEVQETRLTHDGLCESVACSHEDQHGARKDDP